MATTRHILQRLIYGLILMIDALVLNFFLIHAAPGDVAEVIGVILGVLASRCATPCCRS